MCRITNFQAACNAYAKPPLALFSTVVDCGPVVRKMLWSGAKTVVFKWWFSPARACHWSFPCSNTKREWKILRPQSCTSASRQPCCCSPTSAWWEKSTDRNFNQSYFDIKLKMPSWSKHLGFVPHNRMVKFKARHSLSYQDTILKKRFSPQSQSCVKATRWACGLSINQTFWMPEANKHSIQV